MTLVYSNVMWACVCAREYVVVVVWQGPMEEQFLYGIYEYIWSKRKTLHEHVRSGMHSSY